MPPGQTQRAESKFIVFEQFEKMNTQSVRQALSEKEVSWLENLQPIAGNNLTTVPGPNGPISSISSTIFLEYYANLGTVDYIISFARDGSAWATNIATGASIQFAAPGTFTNPDMTVWNSQVALFNDPTAGYSTWNGTTFVRQGGVSPVLNLTYGGSNYSIVPTVTITGGSGMGATAVATIGTPTVIAVNVITGGSQYGPAPGVVFAGGGGIGAAATAIIDPRSVLSLTVTNFGTYFTPPTSVTLVGGSPTTTATASATWAVNAFSTYQLASLTLTNPGAGYSSAPTVQFNGGVVAGGGTGAAQAVATVGNGRVLSIIVTNGGSGYTSAPSVSFTGGGAGSGVSAAAVVGGSGVTSVTLTNPGSGYLASDVLSVAFTGGGQTPLTINSGSYTSGTGAVSLTMSAPITFGAGVTVEILTITGTATALVGNPYITTAGTTGSTVTFTAATGLGGITITGGTLILGSIATATAHVWPFVPAGTTLAIFQGRVWLGGNRLLQYTGVNGFDDFSAANASGSLTITDSDLTHAITALRNYNNYLFIMGDQAVKQIGNISLNNAGNITLFTILTLSSDQGTIYTQSCGSFNRVFMFINTNGVYAVFGSSVQKISDDLDGIFKLIDFTQAPQSCIIDINDIHHIAWLVRYKDPVAGTRSILLAFNGKKWFVISQGNLLAAVTTASTLASGKTLTFASSGSDITQICANINQPVPFKVQTALTHHGNAVQRKKMLAGGTAVTASGKGIITVSFDTENASVSRTYNLASGFQLPGGQTGAEGSGRYLGLTITGTLSSFIFTNAALEYQETSLWT